MALCSQAFSTSNKRSCTLNTGFESSPAKKICLSKLRSGSDSKNHRVTIASNPAFQFPVSTRTANGAAHNNKVVYSSSENDDDSDDEQSCYNADQIKAKRRASTRVSFSLNTNSALSKAISKYSDDDDDDEDSSINNNNTHHPIVDGDDCSDNIDCKLSSPINNSTININPATPINQGFNISDHSNQPLKKSIPESDKHSRSKCFEYLVGAIDEAWARYCDATTYVEDETYGYNTPNSVATDDEDYFGNTTDFTDYDSEFEHHHSKSSKPHLYTPSTSPSTPLSNSSKDPSSCQLQALKDRLTKAKYFLQDLVDSDDCLDASAFWKRWDMIKYATIELVEDDDDDDVVESTIDELEDGRLFAN